jgi:uncharacterized protein YdeI (YjbR/CyaY-like superfamily)
MARFLLRGAFMSAALSYGYENDGLRSVTTLTIPVELAALFEESSKAKATYYRLDDHDRRGFIRYIELATTPLARERRAAIIATSLLGLSARFADS